jgi:hypothetical protein
MPGTRAARIISAASAISSGWLSKSVHKTVELPSIRSARRWLDLKNEQWLPTPGLPCVRCLFARLSRVDSSFLGGGPSCLLPNLVGLSWDGSATASNQKVQIRSLMRLKNMVNIQFCPTTLGSRWCCPLRTALTQGCVVHIQPN